MTKQLKKALMNVICTLQNHISKVGEIQDRMEDILIKFVLPDLGNQQALLRARACQVYGIYRYVGLNDVDHIEKIVEGIVKNMNEDQPLPVKFHAACSLEKILRHDVALQYIEPEINGMLKSYLNLMHILDNEELISAFERIMMAFKDEIKPYAVDICKQMNQ